MLDYQLPRIAQEDVTDTNGTFVVEPLERGFGYTYGNALRRVLLSSIEGAAVTSVKIEGVQHEFSSIKGVREDVTDIILNLKGLFAVLHGDSGEVEARILKDGPAIVTAADIDVSSELEIMNPELEICHLADGARLEMTLTVGRGRGYVAATDNKGPETTIGVIPVDSIFSPVRRVSVSVDPARVGQRTDFDRLTLDVATDGSLTPRDAIQQAAELMIRQLAIFTDLDTSDLSALVGINQGGAAEPDVPQANGMENILIEELELGVRSYNCLKRVGIETIGDLVSRTEQELAAIPNFGKKSIEEVKETLGTHGLRLRGDD
jgi:DNA-directed RNA polymerase subunit alpha